MSRVGRFFRLVVCAGAAVVLGVSLYVGLVQLGVLRSPFAPVVGGDVALARSERPGLRVLFVGNSFTAQNSMPALVHRLAAADEDGPPVFAVRYTAALWTLRKASRDEGLAALLEDVPWDVVVLQEQSQLLSFPLSARLRETYPFARALHERIASAGGRTLLFMTWGYEKGDRRNEPGDTYAAMQARLERGYADLAAELSAPVAPVGLAWAEALRRRPGLDLWGFDGKHPSRMGSYLTACVFYATLSGRNPSASEFTDGLAHAEARFLQRVAADVVRRFPRQTLEQVAIFQPARGGV